MLSKILFLLSGVVLVAAMQPLFSSGSNLRASFTRNYIPGTISATQIVYNDELADGWSDVSWESSIDFANSSLSQEGMTSLSVTYTGAWGALHLTTEAPLSGGDHNLIRFWLHGGEVGNQELRLVLADTLSTFRTESVPIQPMANEWMLVEIPFTLLGEPPEFYGFALQDTTGAAQPTFYIDDVRLMKVVIPPTATPTPTSTPSPTPTITPTPSSYLINIDTVSERHPISPEIYGMNFASEAVAEAVKLPVRRWGGNATTRWNWQIDTTNLASDWFFLNAPDSRTNVATLPDGSSADLFIEQNLRTNTRTLMTIPMIGWVAKERNLDCGFAIAKYGEQQQVAPNNPVCGNGVKMDGTMVTGNDPADTSLAVDTQFVIDWITHLTNKYGNAGSGGISYYSLDNEPMLWSKTHRDLHPEPVGYEELREKSYAYGAAVKEADPSAMTIGPVLWGWTAYFYSALDQTTDEWWKNPLDRNAHGGLPLTAWYLQEMKAYEDQHSVRILDYLDLHYYPASEGVALASVGDAETQALRLRSTRSLWDASYVDESWINQPIRFIPMMREWIEEYYPGTKIAISEYNWGGLEDINGALTQADVLGIFGREGVHMAMLWDPGPVDAPYINAFRMYRDYDGQGSTFGDVSIHSLSQDQERISVYAAHRTDDNALTIMLINKMDFSLEIHMNIKDFEFGEWVQVYQYSADNLSEIVRTADVPTNFVGLTTNVPAESISLMIVPTFVPTPTPDPLATATFTPTPTPTVDPLAPTQPSTATPTPSGSIIPGGGQERVPSIYLPLIQ
ncbi:MAG: glycoside hydrolase family 44 protein [Chloroflexota bacterium]